MLSGCGVGGGMTGSKKKRPVAKKGKKGGVPSLRSIHKGKEEEEEEEEEPFGGILFLGGE